MTAQTPVFAQPIESKKPPNKPLGHAGTTMQDTLEAQKSF